MRGLRRNVCVSFVVGSWIVACTGGGGAVGGTGTGTTAGAFSFTASSDAAAAPGAKAIVVWGVSATSPDYSYVFGKGSADGNQVTISFPSSPPPEALNDGKLGIGILAVIDASVDVPEGKVTDDKALAAILAFAPQHAIVYRNGSDPVLRNGWDTRFPQGFACGRCVDQDAGFDTFEVTDCSSVHLVPYSKSVKSCNWT